MQVAGQCLACLSDWARTCSSDAVAGGSGKEAAAVMPLSVLPLAVQVRDGFAAGKQCLSSRAT